MSERISEAWDQVISQELAKLYMKRLMRFLRHERRLGKEIYPPQSEIFEAFSYCPPHRIKAVIVGQDPYHTPGFADGMAFSVSVDRDKPPSLINIFKELESDLGYPQPNHGSLIKWACEGVILLNTCLTVEKGKPGSHRNLGWEAFSDRIIEWLHKNKEPIAFILWGKDSFAKEHLIDKTKHLVIKSTHPSPFSASVSTRQAISFFGSQPFSQVNKFLIKAGRIPIDWQIVNRV